MKLFFYCMVNFVFLLLACSLQAQPLPPSYKLFPLPVSELEAITVSWLRTSGFQVSELSFNMGQRQFSAQIEGTIWKILLKPHSPLATELWLESDADQAANGNQLAELGSYLNDYIDSLASESDTMNEFVPSVVNALAQTVVCIKATINDEEIQISGFFTDKQGLIISTAHDLTEFHTIKVLLWDGQEHDAIIVKKNPEKDLTLLHINYTPDAYISLLNGRSILAAGERLFSISCRNNQPGIIKAGALIRPPVTVDKQLLWKISMETLHGSSGSPVIDQKGNLFGVVKGKYRGRDAIGFLIPFETILEFLNTI